MWGSERERERERKRERERETIEEIREKNFKSDSIKNE